MLGIDKKAIFSIKNIYLYNPYLATLKPLSTRDGVILTLSFPDNIKFLEGLLCNCNPFLCPNWGKYYKVGQFLLQSCAIITKVVCRRQMRQTGQGNRF